MDDLLRSHRFKILDKKCSNLTIQQFTTKKIETKLSIHEKTYHENKELFSKLNSLWLEDIKNINDEIHKDHNDIFLFGAHIFLPKI